MKIFKKYLTDIVNQPIGRVLNFMIVTFVFTLIITNEQLELFIRDLFLFMYMIYLVIFVCKINLLKALWYISSFIAMMILTFYTVKILYVNYQIDLATTVIAFTLSVYFGSLGLMLKLNITKYRVLIVLLDCLVFLLLLGVVAILTKTTEPFVYLIIEIAILITQYFIFTLYKQKDS